MSSIKLYDWQIVEVHKLNHYLNQKYGQRRNTMQTLNELQNEATTRLRDLGLVATVDITPCFVGEPPSITIEGFVAPKAFDHDEKAWEVKKAKESGEEIHGLPKGE